MVSAWRETMAFDSRRRLAEIGCPTLVVAASNELFLASFAFGALFLGVIAGLVYGLVGASTTLSHFFQQHSAR